MTRWPIRRKPIVLESMTFPDPVISVAIEPKTKADQEKLGTAIQKLAEEDPTFKVKNDEETGQTVISGMGELHLDILVDRMKREFNVEANIGKPQVAYRETIRGTVEKYGYTHKKQTGGSGQFAKILITVEPLDMTAEETKGATYEFVNAVTGGRIPREYIPSVDAGAQDALQYGILAGYPMLGVKLTLVDGAYHEVDSSEMAFKIAGSIAMKEAARLAKPVLLEPMMSVEVVTPEDNMGDVIGDLNSRRGQIQAHVGALRRPRRHRPGAAVGDVRLRRRPAVADPGPGVVLDGLRLLRGGSGQRGEGSHREGDRRLRKRGSASDRGPEGAEELARRYRRRRPASLIRCRVR